jgi:tetratricopeptide (TPR) repeat protein
MDSTDLPGPAPEPARPGRRKKGARPIHAGPTRLQLEQLMETMLGPIGRRESKADRKARAQDLFYQAMETRSSERAKALLEEAVALDPACVDALAVMVDVSDGDLEWRIAGMRTVVEVGQEDLGKRFFAENRGFFWGLLETRPYMRARQRLAALLLEAGRRDEALAEYEALLDLNPNDNQGIRDILLGQYLFTGRLDRATKLLKAYADDASAVFTWGGDESEAAFCVEILGAAWRRSAAAVEWLRAQGKGR